MAKVMPACSEANCEQQSTDRCLYCGHYLCYAHTIRVTDPQEGWISLCQECRERDERESRERHGIW